MHKNGNPKRAPKRRNSERSAAFNRNHEKGIRADQDAAQRDRRLEYLLDCGRVQMAVEEGLITREEAAAYERTLASVKTAARFGSAA